MNKTNTLKSILTLSIGLFVASCGSDGTNAIQFSNTDPNGLSPFRVLSSTPAWNQFYVLESTKSISIRLSEDVANDQSNLDSNIQVVSNYDPNNIANACGGTPVAATKSANGSLIAVELANELLPDTNYAVLIYQGLKSTAGHTLEENSQPFSCFYINFSTGSSGLGHSVAGAPQVLSVDRTSSGTFSAIIRFNETLAMQPTIRIKYKVGLFDPVEEFAYAYPVLTYDNSVWRVDTMQVPGMGATVTVYVDDFIDIDEGLHGKDADTDGHPFTFYL